MPWVDMSKFHQDSSGKGEKAESGLQERGETCPNPPKSSVAQKSIEHLAS